MSRNEKIIDSLLLKVEKPSRYTGGEYNTPDMNKPSDVRVCMCFPDMYEVGMSNLGIRILYHMLNDMEGIISERCFAPKYDLRDELKANNIPLFSLETKRELKEFDIIGISVQFEMLYTNIFYMLDLANIPFYARLRDENYPILIGGGPCSVNPEPYAEIFDIIVIGEGEESMKSLVNLYREHKKSGYNKQKFLEDAELIEGVYIPLFAEVSDSGRFTTIQTNRPIFQTYVRDFENSYFPTAILVPNIEAVHDRPVLELFRGCPNGCRFCQAGFYYRPIRMRSADKIVALGEKTINETGFDEMSLASLSSSDYHNISEVVKRLSDFCERKGVNLALPSLRMDSFSGDMVTKSRLGSLTFAPEAGTERLRDVINKNIKDEDIEKTMRAAFKAGYSSVKLYFMIGLPTETMEDIEGIRDMVLKIKRIYSEEVKGRPLNINVSAAIFIPKPNTPFQWEAQIDDEAVNSRQMYLRQILKIKGIQFSWHGVKSSILEAVFARGDRKLTKVIELAFRKGCSFDSWSEYFREDLWKEAFNESGIDMGVYTKEIDVVENLPWDFINFYVSKDYLLKERLNSLEGVTTESCLSGCKNCSANLSECNL